MLSDVYNNTCEEGQKLLNWSQGCMCSRDQQSHKWASRLVPKPNGKDDCYGSRVYLAKANSGRELVTDKSSARGKRHRNDFRLVVLQAKQKPRVLHRNKRYVVPQKIDIGQAMKINTTTSPRQRGFRGRIRASQSLQHLCFQPCA